MKFDSNYLINESLFEISAKDLLTARPSEKHAFVKAIATIRNEVPLVNSDPIVPALTYASSQDGTNPFFLPRYVLRAQDGRRTMRLESFPPSDAPDAVAGRLTVEIQALPADDETARVMPHTLALRLGYRLPIDRQTESSAQAFSIAALDGTWHNADPDTHGVLNVEIAPAGGESIKVHATRNTVPKVQSLGTAIGTVRNGVAAVIFRGNASTVALTIELKGEQLFVTELVSIHDDLAGGDVMVLHTFRRDDAADLAPTAWFDLEPPAVVGTTVHRSVTAIPDMETYLRLYSALTRPEYHARLDVSCQATVGRRGIRQTFATAKKKAALQEKLGAKVFHIDKTTANRLRDSAVRGVVEQPELLFAPDATFNFDRPASSAVVAEGTAVEPSERLRVDAEAFGAMRDFALARRGGAGDRVALHRGFTAADFARRAIAAREAAEAAERKRAEQERQREQAARLQAFMLNAFKKEISKKALPPHVMVEASGKPFLTRRKSTSKQIIARLAVDPDLYADRLDAPMDASNGVVLLRREVNASGQSTIFYQDGLDLRQVWYEPQEFRLDRDDGPPYAPALLFHLVENSAEDTEDEAQPGFSVTMTYRLRPYISDSLIQEAQKVFGAEAVIAPIMPAASALTIRLPATAADPGPESITRTDVIIDFADGLQDAITLSEAEFNRLTAAFQTVTAIGLEGEVDVTFPDGRSGQVPVRLGLRETLGTLFTSRTAEGASVAFTNRIESPAQILSFPVVKNPDGPGFAAQNPPPDAPVAPGETVHATYSEAGPLPILTDAVAEPDLLAILAQCIVVQGYGEDSFEITVAVDPMFFSFTPDGAEPLTGLEVTFRTREEPVVLTPDQASQRITLPMPLILFLTNAEEAQHYSYAVRDLHTSGPGAETAFRAGSGDLDVEPATLSNTGGAD